MRRASLLFLVLAACVQRVVPAPPVPVTNDDWRAKRPAAGPEPRLVLPRFQEVVLPNGFRVLVHERHDLPIATALVAFSAGSAADPSGQAGLADLTYRVMLEGAGERSSQQFADALADLGATPITSISPDGALLGVQLLSRNLEPAVALLAEAARKPHLATSDFLRRRKERRNDLLARETEPHTAAADLMDAAVYGSAHPYGHPTAGTSDRLPSLRAEDARSFYRLWVGPQTTALILTGDITLSDARALGQRYFGSWQGPALRPPRPAPAPPPAKMRVLVLPQPDLGQTLVLVGRSAVPSDDPDEPGLDLTLTALGGAFASRLNLNLREDKAMTYGTWGTLDARRGAGSWVVGAQVHAVSTGLAVQEMLRELDGLHTHPITEEELDRARGALVRALPASFETSESTAFALATLFFEERPLDETDRQVRALQAATPAQLRQEVERYFGRSTLQIVLVGDPDLLQAQLAALKLGPLEVKKRAP